MAWRSGLTIDMTTLWILLDKCVSAGNVLSQQNDKICYWYLFFEVRNLLGLKPGIQLCFAVCCFRPQDAEAPVCRVSFSDSDVCLHRGALLHWPKARVFRWVKQWLIKSYSDKQYQNLLNVKRSCVFQQITLYDALLWDCFFFLLFVFVCLSCQQKSEKKTLKTSYFFVFYLFRRALSYLLRSINRAP